MRLKKDSSKIAEKIESVFSSDYIKSVSKEEKFVQRRSGLDGLAFLGSNISCVGSTGFCSLTEQSGKLLKDYNLSITKKGLNDRFNKFGVNFMKRILEESLSMNLQEHLWLDKLSSFTGLFIKDATGKQLPKCYADIFKGSGGSSSVSGLKVDFSYDLLSDEMEMSLRDGASSDANSPLKTYKAGSLHLWDLGYFNTERFEQIALSNAFFYKSLQTRNKHISRYCN
jgi:hypothetical protein